MNSDADTIRLFVALPVSPALIAQAHDLPRKGIDARWVHSDDLHITLRFLGDVARDKIPAIEEALDRVRRPAFSVEVRGLDAFRGKDQAVLYARIESVKKILTLCADITDVLTPMGFDFGPRPVVPHITLARIERAAGLDAYISRAGRGMAARWEADAFYLMQSGGVGRNNRRYSVIRSYPLPRK